MDMKLNIQKQRGQSMIETALLFPILLLLFAGMIEVVFICRTYLVMLDSSYQGAHVGVQGKDLYDDSEVYTLVTQDLEPYFNNSNLIDVIITRGTLNGGTSVSITTVDHMKGSTRPTTLTPAIISSRLRSGDLYSRFIAVEVVYDQPLLFNFFYVKGLIPNPFPLVAYTIQYVMH
jgi:TadE-like protein